MAPAATVAFHGNGARIGGIAVVPSHEVVAIFRSCLEGNGGQILLRCGTRNSTHYCVSGLSGDGVAVGVEGCGEEAVAFHGNSARIGGVAIVPSHEVVAIFRSCLDGYGGQILLRCR